MRSPAPPRAPAASRAPPGWRSPPVWASRNRSASEPVRLLDDLPVGILVEDLAAAELVHITAAVVQLLAILALDGHRPHRHRAGAAHEDVDVVPPHVGNDLETIGQNAPDRFLAVHAAAYRFGPARHQKRTILSEEGHDPVDVAAVEGSVDLLQQRERRARDGLRLNGIVGRRHRALLGAPHVSRAWTVVNANIARGSAGGKR